MRYKNVNVEDNKIICWNNNIDNIKTTIISTVIPSNEKILRHCIGKNHGIIIFRFHIIYFTFNGVIRLHTYDCYEQAAYPANNKSVYIVFNKHIILKSFHGNKHRIGDIVAILDNNDTYKYNKKKNTITIKRCNGDEYELKKSN